ncbi:hypothetical protein SteCoe_12714 [Stentor coeruleus]|uniref:Transmembrane protein n=1 Tax=Stentor coeruleus TaxID=5963 RepID=A0A1R2CA46_9CILI|nr:hypothetical protein SteCoe_12714 [Stentor coeruleus]
MFSKKSKIYQQLENEIVLELHKEGTKNIKLNTKFRIICILSILLSIISPWYYKNEHWSNIYLYMICTDYIPTNCKMFTELFTNCSLSSTLCSEIQKTMKAGFVVIIFFTLSIICHLISMVSIKSATTGILSFKFSVFVYLAFAFYVIGFLSWIFISGFHIGENTAMYGLTAAFTSTFIGLFVLVHFFTFSKFILSHYSVPVSESASNASNITEKIN